MQKHMQATYRYILHQVEGCRQAGKQQEYVVNENNVAVSNEAALEYIRCHNLEELVPCGCDNPEPNGECPGWEK